MATHDRFLHTLRFVDGLILTLLPWRCFSKCFCLFDFVSLFDTFIFFFFFFFLSFFFCHPFSISVVRECHFSPLSFTQEAKITIMLVPRLLSFFSCSPMDIGSKVRASAIPPSQLADSEAIVAVSLRRIFVTCSFWCRLERAGRPWSWSDSPVRTAPLVALAASPWTPGRRRLVPSPPSSAAWEAFAYPT